MEKIPTIFVRDPHNMRCVVNEITHGTEWVHQGEGVPLRKYDGTCCMVRDGRLFKRYELRRGKVAPAGFEWAATDWDPGGKQPGWVPVGDGPEDKWHREAFAGLTWADGTYELCGPKVQGNPEGFLEHVLIPHKDADILPCEARTFAALRAWLTAHDDIEGIVWHHPDGRMAKLKGRDFGIRRRKYMTVDG